MGSAQSEQFTGGNCGIDDASRYQHAEFKTQFELARPAVPVP